MGLILLGGAVSEHIAAGMNLALVLVFTLSAVEKAQSLIHRTPEWHPVLMASSRRRRHARLLMALGLAADVSISLALIYAPHVGDALAIVVIGVYTLATRGMELTGSSCRCIHRVLDARTRTGLLVRNSALVLVAIVGSAAAAVTLASVLVAVLVLLLIQAIVWVSDRVVGTLPRKIGPLSVSSEGRIDVDQ